MAAWAPTVERARLYGSLEVTVRQPLLPGYVLLHGSDDDVSRATAGGRVLEVVPLVEPAGCGVGLPHGHPLLGT